MTNSLCSPAPRWLRAARTLALSLALPLALAAAAVAQKPPKLVAPKFDPDKIYDAVSEPALPVTGLEGYSQFIDDHLNFPVSALKRRVQGTDSVQFVIEKNGTTTHHVLVKGFDAECDAEALRVIKSAPKWKPGKHRGVVVRQRVTIPVTFALPDVPAGGGAFAADSAQVDFDNKSAAIRAPGSGADPMVRTPGGVPPPAPASAASKPSNGPSVAPAATKATPPGGTDAFFVWIQHNINYPPAAKRAQAEGKLQVEFMIETDGTITNVKALNHLPLGLEQEGLRVIKSSPKWAPAMFDGRSIRQKMVLPVIFQL